ncbi:ATPase, putative [Plasmodium knowlesi strain H]|uniref:ATPase, putative n=3 Tax=Plasmodium knowlesi TaxID=5850 RepID=A0A5K1VMI3_PLAKH|nr:AAA family ATPase, putative [Plasmodium knowlesi strain H]OTN67742.1 putative ATPase [Plasmodium knowlesi]CAA9990481.1 AAA family ATPase, putative [Plasmodium knowlesi strain H]SBO19698.1 ATPase, putative [Plasmodium knowlesi strain H]SBO22482.1 ATPase, putative [Plasmodium knowlesi strain H]VVS79955.1 AAA family ATPase, putative [Plasmodium knowlesi strain H]|eukprot:XP_002260870.1 ATPase, putative [Plasmodium knowlesi strain H]
MCILMDTYHVNLNFFTHDEEEERVNIASNFNLHCSRELLKQLKLNENDNVVLCRTKGGRKAYVCCCVKGCSELNLKKQIKWNDVFANTFLLSSLKIGVSSEREEEDGDEKEHVSGVGKSGRKKETQKKHQNVSVEIRKAELYTPIKQIKLGVQEIINESYENLKDYYHDEHSSYMLQTFWNNLKSKNMERYINLSLLNTCLFPGNCLKICVLGVHTRLTVTDLVVQMKEKQNWDVAPLGKGFRVPYVSQSSKIVVERANALGSESSSSDANSVRNSGDNSDDSVRGVQNGENGTEGRPKGDASPRDSTKKKNKNGKEKNYPKNTESRKKKGLKKIGGYQKIKDEIYYYILLPLIYKNIYDEFHIDINRGILLHGPPGCGKTFIALAIKEELLQLRKKLSHMKLKKKMNHLIRSKKEGTPEQCTKTQTGCLNESGELTHDHFKDDIILPEMEILRSTDLIDNNNSGSKINELFLRCYKRYKEENKCSIVFIDEIEVLCEKRENANINLYTSTLLNNMDGIKKNTHTILIGATNYINQMDLALRRSGRFDKDIEINVPNLKDRISIFKNKLSRVHHNISVKQMKEIADMCQSFTCSDINALINVSMYIYLRENRLVSRRALRKTLQGSNNGDVVEEEGKEVKKGGEEKGQYDKESKGIKETVQDDAVGGFSPAPKPEEPEHLLKYKHLLKGLKYVKPSGMKELYVDIPKTRIKDIGGYQFVKRCIKECLIYPKKYKHVYEKYNIQSPKGILLYGPPGCSKTLFAKAIASEINMNFISVKGPEIFSKYVGESEKTIRNIFKKARENNPCVIFFDEIDSIAVNRNLNQNFVTNRVLCQLLNEIDGIYNRVDVIILAATNRPDLIDPALLRPGRFDRIIYVPLPNYKSRLSILRKTLKFYKINNMINGRGENDPPSNSCVRVINEETSRCDGKSTPLKGDILSEGSAIESHRNTSTHTATLGMVEKVQMKNEKHYVDCNLDSCTPTNGLLEKEEKAPNRIDLPICEKGGENSKTINEEHFSEGKNNGGHMKEEHQREPLPHNNNNNNFTELCQFLAKKTKKYSGAEIVNICREASICALRETLKNCRNEKQIQRGSFTRSSLVGLRKEHFVKVLKKIKPQTSDKLINFYKKYNEQKKG